MLLPDCPAVVNPEPDGPVVPSSPVGVAVVTSDAAPPVPVAVVSPVVEAEVPLSGPQARQRHAAAWCAHGHFISGYMPAEDGQLLPKQREMLTKSSEENKLSLQCCPSYVARNLTISSRL